MHPERVIKVMITQDDATIINLQIVPHQWISPSLVKFQVFGVDNQMKRDKNPSMEMVIDHTKGTLDLTRRLMINLMKAQDLGLVNSMTKSASERKCSTSLDTRTSPDAS